MPAWQHQCCWLSPVGVLNTARTTAVCPEEKHLATHLQNTHPPARKKWGCFEAFLEKPQNLQPTLGWHSPAFPAQPSPVPAPIADTQTSLPGMSGSSEGQWVPDKQCLGVDQRLRLPAAASASPP